jgi:hypothetical protein
MDIIARDKVAAKSIGNSCLTIFFLILIGEIKEATPMINKTLTIQLPIALAKTIPVLLLANALKEIATSGAHVPNAIIVKAIIDLGIFNFKARDDEASTKISDAFNIKTNPINNNKYVIFLTPTHILTYP